MTALSGFMLIGFGWMQVGLYHQGLAVGETPNIDRIGREGARFMDWPCRAARPDAMPSSPACIRCAPAGTRGGGRCSPTVISDLIRDELESMIDHKAWRRSKAKETSGRSLLNKVAENWSKVKKTLKA
jgi:hypothetical protein